jgi:hypothetical protein
MTMMTDREITIAAIITARSWRDPEYLAALIRDPRAVLADEGLELPDDEEVRVVADTDTVKYIHITAATRDGDLLAPVLRKEVPLSEGSEIRIVQSTDRLHYFVVSAPPPDLDISVASETQLITAATPDDTVRIVNYVGAVDYEGEAVGTTTTVTAEAEAVIVIVLT